MAVIGERPNRSEPADFTVVIDFRDGVTGFLRFAEAATTAPASSIWGRYRGLTKRAPNWPSGTCRRNCLRASAARAVWLGKFRATGVPLVGVAK